MLITPSFTALAEIFCAEPVPRSQCDRRYGHCGAGDNAVDMAVHKFDLSCLEQIVDQKLFAEPLCCIMLDIFGEAAVLNSIIIPSFSRFDDLKRLCKYFTFYLGES